MPAVSWSMPPNPVTSKCRYWTKDDDSRTSQSALTQAGDRTVCPQCAANDEHPGDLFLLVNRGENLKLGYARQSPRIRELLRARLDHCSEP